MYKTILITSAVNFGVPSFGKGGYQYPDYAVVLCNVLAFAPLISIFVVAAVLVAIKGTESLPANATGTRMVPERRES
ncbi:hypothetical protein MAR_017964 [Mya arenaria]|uniref:Uncharacterized protein n=1 Tax=Mya arenaria TaxID=6604 RepID=A0ABY7ELC7_MYAAR|nr:hypothetical protein MAR_017964 [Mya arenaria]